MTYESIADFVLGPTKIPDDVRTHAAKLLIDTLGVAAGAAGLEVGRIVRDHAVSFHAAPDAKNAATLLFDGRKASIPGMCFAMGSQIDNLDAHDGYNPTKGHIGCAVVPALCAFAEGMPDLTAQEALDAMVIAYEVAARAAVALHTSVSDYHTSGAWNALGVVALVARLRGYSSDQLRQAFGIAEYHGPRSQMMREIANPTMLHDGSGQGAMVGAMAALLAEEGFTGAPALTIEDAASHWDDLGTLWTVPLNYIKPYPICRWAHAAIDATDLILRREEIAPDDISTIEINTFAEAAALYPGMPETTSQAQYSLHFAVATRAVHGEIGPQHVSGPGLSDPAIAAMLGRITVTEEPGHSARFPEGRWSDVVITTTDGTRHASGDVHATGGPEAPRPLQDIEAKFHTMAADLPKARRIAIWAMLGALPDPDFAFSELLNLIHAPV